MFGQGGSFMNKHEFGMRGEDIACRMIESEGGEILERNFHFHGGEIDIICRIDGYLTFAEVKYRTSEKCGLAHESVNLQKQRTISRGCDYYLCRNGLSEFTAVRFDVIALTAGRFDEQIMTDWIKDAFLYVPGGAGGRRGSRIRR